MFRDIAKIVGETRYLLGLSPTDGASLDVIDMIDTYIGISELPSRIVHRIPPQNYSQLQQLAKISWL